MTNDQYSSIGSMASNAVSGAIDLMFLLILFGGVVLIAVSVIDIWARARR